MRVKSKESVYCKVAALVNVHIDCGLDHNHMGCVLCIVFRL